MAGPDYGGGRPALPGSVQAQSGTYPRYDTGGAAAAPPPPEEKKPSAIISGVKRGTGGALAAVAQAGEDVGLPLSDVREYGQKLEAENPATVTDIPGILQHPLQFTKETVGELAPQFGISLGGAAAGARLGALGNVFGPEVGGPTTVAGGVLGAFLPSFVQSYGGQRIDQNAAGIDDKGRAALAAAGSAALDVVGPEEMLARRLATGTLEKGGGAGLKGIIKQAGKGALFEGATEGAQQVIEDYGTTGQVGQNPADIAMAAAKGAVGGGVAGATHQVLGKHGKDKTQNLPEETAPAETLALPAPGDTSQPTQLLLTDQRQTAPAAVEGPATPAALPAPPPKQIAAPADTSVMEGQPPGPAGQQALPAPRTPAEIDSIDTPTLMQRGVKQVESRGRTGAISPKGALGVNQMLPETARAVARRLGEDYKGDTALRWNDAYNDHLSNAYMDQLRQDFGGDTFLAVTAYHAGPGNVRKWMRDFNYDPSNREAFLTDIRKAGNPESAKYPNLVLKAMGRDTFGGAGPHGEVDVADNSPEAITRRMADLSGVPGLEDHPQAQALAEGISKGGDEAARVIKIESDRLADDHASLIDRQNTMLPAEVQRREGELANRERILSAAVDSAQRLAKARGPTLVTEPGPLDTSRIPGPAPRSPELSQLGQDLALREANQFSARSQMDQSKEALAERAMALRDIIRNKDARSPRADFAETLQNMGLHPEPTDAEHMALSRRESYLAQEDRRAQEAQRQAAVQQAAQQQAALPEQDVTLGIPERRAPAPREEAAPAPAMARQIAEQNVRERARQEAADIRERSPGTGATSATHFMDGVESGLGDTSIPTPTGPTASQHFARGQQFAERQMGHQERERGGPAEPSLPAIPAGQEPAIPAERPKGGQARRRETLTARAEAQTAYETRRAAEQQAKEAAERAVAERKQKQADARAKRAEEMKAAQKAAPPAAEKAKETSKAKTAAKATEEAAQAPRTEARTKAAPKEEAPSTAEKTQVERELEKEGVTETQDEKFRRQLMERVEAARKAGTLSQLEAKALRDQITDTAKVGGKTVPKNSTAKLTTILDNVLGPQEQTSTRQRAGQPLPPPSTASREEVKRYWENVRDAARKELDRVGLKNVDLKFFSKMLQDAHGSYVAPDEHPGLRHLIQLSLNHDEQLGTLDHEIIHAMREMDLFTEPEWDALVKEATGNPEINDRIERDYAESHPDIREEEKVAELYREWAANKIRVSSPIATIFNKVKAALKALGVGFKRMGTPTAEAVMNRIMSGEVGARKQGYTRGERGVRAGGVSRGQVYPGGEVGPQMGGLWRKASGPEAMPKARSPEAFARRTTTERAAAAVKTTGWNLTKQLHLWLTGTEDMANMMAQHMQMPSARRVVDLHSRSHALGRAFQERLVNIKDDYQKLSAALKGTGEGSVSKFLYDSTISGKWGYAPEGVPKAVVDPKLAEQFNAMPKEAQKVIKDIFKFGDDSRNQMRDALTGAINAEFDPLIAGAKTDRDRATFTEQKARALKNFSRIYDTQEGLPYSPLKRDGAFAVIGKSDEYRAAEAAKDTKLLDKLSQDPKHYFVDFRDTADEAEALHHHVEQQFGGEGSYWFERSKSPMPGAINSEELYLAFSQLKHAVAAGSDGSKSSERLQRLVNDLYLHSLSETSARKGELGRQKVSAVDPVTKETMNMVHAFVSRGNATANYIASIDNGPKIQKALTDMAAEMGRLPSYMKTDGARMFNEMMYRYTANLSRQPTRIADKIVRAVSFQTLLSSPFYYAQNFTQAALISTPVLASKYGYGTASRHMFQGYADYMNMIKGGGRLDFSKAPADVADVLRRLAERGRLDAGFSNELGSWEVNGDGLLPKTWNKVDKFLRDAPQKVETANRVATGIAAYRAAIEAGKSDEVAFEEASKLIHDTHGDYSGFNSPTPFTAGGGVAKVALQFRKFQLIMGGLLAREFHHAFKGETPEVRRQGFAALGFLSAHMAAIGGILAQPGMNLLGTVVGTLMNLIDQDDDKDWSNWQEDLRVALGAGGEGAKRNILADMLYKGAPYALLNMDTSDRLGMGNIAALAPYTDLPEAASSKEKAMAAIGKLMLGPSGGLVEKAVDGWGFGVQQGDWARMVETMMPVGASNLMKAVRLKNEGLTTKQGDTLVSPQQISDLDAFYTAMGVRPRSLVNQAERRSNDYSANEYYTAQTSRIKQQYVNAVRNKDGEAQQQARADFEAIQKARLRDGFPRQPLSTLLTAPAAQLKREKSVIGGVETNRQNREFVSRMMYADNPADALQEYGEEADY